MVGNKAKRLSQKREDDTDTDAAHSWLAIPIELRNKIRHKQCSLEWAQSGYGTAKSWNMSPKRCPSVGKFISLLPQLRHTINRETCFYYVYIGGYQIPTWDSKVPYKKTAVSFCNHNNPVLLVVTGVSHPAFVYYKPPNTWEREVSYGWSSHFPEEHKWVNENCTLIDPHSSSQQYMQFSNIVSLDGKFYALSLQGTLVVIEEVDSRMVITKVGSSRAVPSVFSKHFREYLTESSGKIFLIFLISKKSNYVVDTVEIFRLQVRPRLTWKKMATLGEMAVVVGADTCWVIDRRGLRCMGNCVYFTNLRSNSWWVYDMAKGDISQCTWHHDTKDII